MDKQCLLAKWTTIFIVLVNAVRLICGQREECVIRDIPVQEDFNETQYEGKWYEVHWRPTYFEDPNVAFIDYVEIYSRGDEEHQVNVDGYGRISESHENCRKVGKTLTQESPAKYTYPTAVDNGTITVDYWVIATDYTHYSLVYGCTIKEMGKCNMSHAWVWSRTPKLDDQYYDIIEAKLPEICLEMGDFISTAQNEECEGSINRGSSLSVHFAFFSWMIILVAMY